MREILFRGKRLDNGKWIEGNILLSEDADEDFRAIIIPTKDSNMYTDNEERDLGVECWFKVDPETVCQYTGLTDKNGKKIFEGDIVTATHTRYKESTDDEWMPIPETEEYTRNYAVEFINSGCNLGYRLRNKNIHFMITKNTVFNHKIEVIGNIFDNPELLTTSSTDSGGSKSG